MTNYEDFDPKDPKYKSLEDLPKSAQEDYVQVGDGFVTKEAAALSEQVAETAYKNKKYGRGPVDSKDVLQEDAQKYLDTKEEIIKILQKNRGFSGRSEVIESIRKAMLKGDYGDWGEPGKKKYDGNNAESEDYTALARDKDFILQGLEFYPGFFAYADPQLRDDKEFVIKVLQEKGSVLEWVSPRLVQDAGVVATAFANDPDSIKFAPIEMRKNRDMMLKAIKHNPSIIKCADQSLLDDKNFIFKAIAEAPSVSAFFGALPDDLKKKEVLMKLVESGLRLGHLYRLKIDDDIRMAAVKKSARNLRDIKRENSDQYRNLVKYAFSHTDEGISFLMGGNGRFDNESIDIIRALESLSSSDIEECVLANPSLFAEIIRACVDYNNQNRHIYMILQSDNNLIRPMLEADPTIFRILGTSCRSDVNLIEAAMIHDPEAIQFATEKGKEKFTIKRLGRYLEGAEGLGYELVEGWSPIEFLASLDNIESVSALLLDSGFNQEERDIVMKLVKETMTTQKRIKPKDRKVKFLKWGNDENK